MSEHAAFASRAQVVMNDTSYSDMSSEDNRGLAVSELVLEPDSRALVSGLLDDGTDFECVAHVARHPRTALIHSLVGTLSQLTHWGSGSTLALHLTHSRTQRGCI